MDCDGRPTLDYAAFNLSDKLYRGFVEADLDENGRIKFDSLRLPDLSCNWDRFSRPHDVRLRVASQGRTCDEDGCYSITVAEVHYGNFATVVHEPLCAQPPENYSHVEIRELFDGEDKSIAPPRNRPKKGRKQLRHNWRANIVNTMTIELAPL